MIINDILLKTKDDTEAIPSNTYLGDGKYPVVSQDSDAFISGYTNKDNPILDVPVILFGDHSCVLKYVDFPFFRGADGTQLLYVKDDFNARYVYYYLMSVISQLPAYGKYERHFKYLKELPAPEASIATQNDVAYMLGIIDKAINNNNKIIETSEKLMREIYGYWFVQFDFPDENGHPYKSSGGEMVYNETLKREIPKSWGFREIGDIIAEAKKSTVQVNEAKDRTGIFPFFTSGDEIIDFDEYYVDGFNIFLNTGGNADVKSYFGKAAYSTDTWCISAKELSFMLDIFLKDIKAYLNNNCFAGSGLKHLQKNAFKKIRIVIPSDTILDIFNNIASNIYKNIASLQAENKKLTSLRDWLLPMLMNGQVVVDGRI